MVLAPCLPTGTTAVELAEAGATHCRRNGLSPCEGSYQEGLRSGKEPTS